VNVFLAVLWKDLISEWRGRDRFVAMLVFALLVLVVFHFSLPGGVTPQSRELAPGLLWIAYVFAAVLGLNRAFSVELENDALTGLALVPCDRGFIFLGKAAASFLILGVVQVLTALAFAGVFELGSVQDLAPFGLIVALGSIGLCAVGTLLGAVAVRTRFREIMLPLLMLPLLAPVLSGSVRATSALLLDGQLPFEPIQLLLVADAIYLITAFVGFDYVLDE
jgi:heme exporter protein B